ncbi:winged helix DNA-binding domain-containing protein [Nannocystis radixulma]|uniref:Winged helix DNA-binding domain-containing protein n=1 Tax=Nannocystis radixulma TaxID=2995305 RepID=A0ABT5B691_9BACT|nr:winged helix DNA-binding domain-containing protein [Nannocystis radixulma]MDC0668617.1 winged helix DNA-binding domain-containing protein [Nannocystis radixulma]
MPRSSAEKCDLVMDRRALGRALLARQMLLQRHDTSPARVVAHLVGMQAQVPANPFVALWSRLVHLAPAEVDRLLLQRRAVRTSLMRATVHLVDARDALVLRPLLQAVHERTFTGAFGKKLGGVDRAAVLAAGRSLLLAAPRTTAELAELLHPQFPAAEPDALAQAVRYLLPLVQLPPRGCWRASKQATWALTDDFLAASAPPAEPSLDELVLRYLAAFGPASVADLQTWCGLTRLREVVTRLRPQLCLVHDEQGRPLFDLPSAPRPPGDTPAPPRFLPEYDNLLLSHADRSRVVPQDPRIFNKLFADKGLALGALLVDGELRGTWKIARNKARADLTIWTLPGMRAADRQAVGVEAERLLAFVEPDADDRDVRFAA